MFRPFLACLFLVAFTLAGCGKEQPKEVKSIRKLETRKKLTRQTSDRKSFKNHGAANGLFMCLIWEDHPGGKTNVRRQS
jgi:hypothetical protein